MRRIVWCCLIVILLMALASPNAGAAESRDGQLQTTVTSFTVTRSDIPFEVVIYRPITKPQHGTIVLLQGFPGGRVGEGFTPRTHSRAVSLAESGYSVVRFNYIGSWANGGQFSWFGGVLDTEAVLRFIRTREMSNLGIDGSRIALVGHSYGGWVALTTAARDPALRCIAVMASQNLGRTAKVVRGNDEAQKRRITFLDDVLGGADHPIHAESAKALADEVTDHGETWDLVNSIEELQSKKLFFISAGKDDVVPTDLYIQPLIDGLLRANAVSIRTATIEGADHNFSGHVPEVYDMVESWITNECKY